MEARCPYVLDVTGKDIHAQAHELRAKGPATLIELPGGVAAWMVNGYSVAKMMLNDPRISKSAHEHWPAFRNGSMNNWELISWVAMNNISTSHGDDHKRLRKLIGKAFTPRRVALLKPKIVELATRLLDAVEATPPGEVVDLKQAFCYPLPSLLVADLIGMDEAALAETAVVINLMVDTTATPEQAAAVFAGWRDAMHTLIASKRANPGEDMTSDLIAARDDDDKLSEAELTDTIFAILGAGSETTINFLDKSITALLSHPDQLERIRNGESSWDDLMEEVLRAEAPLAALPLRFAIEDIDLGEGVYITKGEPILINYTGVGRDPELHPDGDVFDITREDKEHLAFGFGPHYCLGAAIARLIAEVGLSMLFERYPDLSLAVSADDLEPMPTFIMNGHKALPVRLTAPVPAAAV